MDVFTSADGLLTGLREEYRKEIARKELAFLDYCREGAARDLVRKKEDAKAYTEAISKSTHIELLQKWSLELASVMYELGRIEEYLENIDLNSRALHNGKITISPMHSKLDWSQDSGQKQN